MVRDSHAMGVAAQILEHKLWAPEGWFQIDDPVGSVQGSQPGGKDLRLGEEGEVSVESLSTLLGKPSATADSVSTETSPSSPSRRSLPPGCAPCTAQTGSSLVNHPLGANSYC